MLALTSCGGGGSVGGGGGTPPPPPAATCTVLYTSSPSATQYLPSLLVDNDNVYVSEVSAGNVSIKAIPKVGGTVKILASGPNLGDSTEGLLQDFTIDEFDLYWVVNILLPAPGISQVYQASQVYSVPLGGGSASLIASEPEVNSSAGAVDDAPGITPYGVGGSVYWTTGGTIYSSDIAGTETVFSFLGPSPYNPDMIPMATAGTLVVLNSGDIVTRVLGSGPPYSETGYYKISPNPPNSTAEFLTPFIGGLQGNDVGQGDLITDGVDVYGLANAALGTAEIGPSVFKISGASATVLAQANGTARNVATDDTYLYYAGVGGGVVSAYAIVGNTVTSSQCVTSDGTSFAIGSVGVHGLYSDEGYIYVTGSGGSGALPFNVLKMTKP